MTKHTKLFASFILVLSIFSLSACGTIVQAANRITAQITAMAPTRASNSVAQATTQATLQPNPSASPAATATLGAPLPNTGGAQNGPSTSSTTLENIYTQVSPSVVFIQVIESASGTSQNSPFGGQNQGPQLSQALGSGFVWDSQGHIVTNNHVVAGATTINVTFADGRTVGAKVVATDPYSDLAVIQVDPSGLQLKPVSMGDSKQVKVGETAIAIGNPFGLQNTMTVGIISALGRSLPAGDQNALGPTYQIPDIIQTDAAINPGNSGGVLVNIDGQVIGVTAAIESSNTGTNSGVGFVIPSGIVQKVVPTLIKNGHYDHAYLGISGVTLSPDINKLINLKPDQQGALVEDVVSGGPADQAHLRGSTQQQTINGLDINTGGDVISAINGQQIKTMDELIAYLADSTNAGQKVTLTVLRNGSQQSVDVTLGVRPPQSQQQGQNVPQSQGNGNGNGNGNNNQAGSVYLGVEVIPMDSAILQGMNLPANTRGVLIEQVAPNSPADQAGLQGSSQTITDNGSQVGVGGDIIQKVGNTEVSSTAALRDALNQAQPGQNITLTILRNGQTQQVKVTLGSQP